MTEKKTGTKEWADRNFNIQKGCPYDCRYCYAKEMAIRFKRSTAESWHIPMLDYPCRQVPRHKTPGTTMFPTAHDITMDNYVSCGTTIRDLVKTGEKVLVVTKANPESLKMTLMGLQYAADRIEVRVTIGSHDDEILKFWEPGAPCFADRLKALEWAKAAGYRTSLSIEPMLCGNPMGLIARVLHAVTGEIWIGLPKDLIRRVSVNCPGDAQALAQARLLVGMWNDEWVMKLYAQMKGQSWVRWKDSIRQVVERRQNGKGGVA